MAAEQLDGADPASHGQRFRAILALGWPGGSPTGVLRPLQGAKGANLEAVRHPALLPLVGASSLQ